MRCAKPNHIKSKCNTKREDVKCGSCNRMGHVSNVCLDTYNKKSAQSSCSSSTQKQTVRRAQTPAPAPQHKQQQPTDPPPPMRTTSRPASPASALPKPALVRPQPTASGSGSRAGRPSTSTAPRTPGRRTPLSLQILLLAVLFSLGTHPSSSTAPRKGTGWRAAGPPPSPPLSSATTAAAVLGRTSTLWSAPTSPTKSSFPGTI